jgi:hypothetical protein
MGRSVGVAGILQGMHVMVDAGSRLWKPQGKSKLILDRAWEHVSSVTYQVSLRWVFYRLLQDGLYRNKGDYTTKMKSLFAAARKAFYGPWRPWTLGDDSRASIVQGNGYVDAQDWFQQMADGLEVDFDKWASQPVYVEIWFEARAMVGQFRQYAPGITLVPFGGDFTINPKWETARRLSAVAEKYGKPVQVFYFGDYDPKGLQILGSALKDIGAWCDVDFEIERVGLTLDQAVTMGVPENFEKPGQYQWEALTDAQAASLIARVTDLIDRQLWEEIEREEAEAAGAVRELIRRELLANNGGSGTLSTGP